MRKFNSAFSVVLLKVKKVLLEYAAGASSALKS